MSNEPKAEMVEMQVIYQKSDDFHEEFINGAYGGLTPTRTGVVAWFYTERNAEPKSYTADVESRGEGQVKMPVDPKPQAKLVRTIHGAYHMTPQMAKTIGKWLQGHAEQVLGKSEDEPLVSNVGEKNPNE